MNAESREVIYPSSPPSPLSFPPPLSLPAARSFSAFLLMFESKTALYGSNDAGETWTRSSAIEIGSTSVRFGFEHDVFGAAPSPAAHAFRFMTVKDFTIHRLVLVLLLSREKTCSRMYSSASDLLLVMVMCIRRGP